VKYILLSILIFFNYNHEYSNQKPTKEGIENFILYYKEDIYLDVENFLNDSIYDFYISVDNLSLYNDYDSMELGRYIYPSEIIINNEEKFIDYKLALVSKWKRKQIKHTGKFVKSVLIHELMHVYFNQVIAVLKYNKINVDKNYLPKSFFNNAMWSSEFIEEGVCEYLTQAMNESLYDDNFDLSPVEILNKPNNYEVKYRYSSKYLRPYLDSCYNADNKLFHAIQVLVSNPPPDDKELVNPDKYFQRLK